jgi:hypothetical protein
MYVMMKKKIEPIRSSHDDTLLLALLVTLEKANLL